MPDMNEEEIKQEKSAVDVLRETHRKRVTGIPESAELDIDGTKVMVYWKALTGRQQKKITEVAAKDIIEGIYMHVMVRALDKNNKRIFDGVPMVAMLNDFSFDDISAIYNAMTGINVSAEDIAGN